MDYIHKIGRKTVLLRSHGWVEHQEGDEGGREKSFTGKGRSAGGMVCRCIRLTSGGKEIRKRRRKKRRTTHRDGDFTTEVCAQGGGSVAQKKKNLVGATSSLRKGRRGEENSDRRPLGRGKCR